MSYSYYVAERGGKANMEKFAIVSFFNKDGFSFAVPAKYDSMFELLERMNRVAADLGDIVDLYADGGVPTLEEAQENAHNLNLEKLVANGVSIDNLRMGGVA